MFNFWKRKQSTRGSSTKLHNRLEVEVLESREVPANYTVDTPLDVVAADGLTSLREAINDANSQAPNVQHLTTFAANLSGQTITLNSQLTLEKHIYIAGPGANTLTIQRNVDIGGFRLFEVKGGSSSIIAGLKLRRGEAGLGNGGAILNGGVLTVTGCIIRDSWATAGGRACALSLP